MYILVHKITINFYPMYANKYFESCINKHDFLTIIHEMGANWPSMKTSCAVFVK